MDRPCLQWFSVSYERLILLDLLWICIFLSYPEIRLFSVMHQAWCFGFLLLSRVVSSLSSSWHFLTVKTDNSHHSAHKSERTSPSWSLGLKVSDKLLFWIWSDGLFRPTAVFCAQCSSLKCVSTKRRSVCWMKLRSCCLNDINKSENRRKCAILRLCLCGMSL